MDKGLDWCTGPCAAAEEEEASRRHELIGNTLQPLEDELTKVSVLLEHLQKQ